MNAHKGFTLLELMIVVVVVAILAAVAIPSYQSHMIKTRRAMAAACLLEIQQLMERFYTVNMSYATDTKGNAFTTLPAMLCTTNLAGYYTFSLANQTARTYTLNAAPLGTQGDKDPSSCGTLAINQAGQKTTSKGQDTDGENIPGGDVNTCWR